MAAGIAERVSAQTAAAAEEVVCRSSVTASVMINVRWTGRDFGVDAETDAAGAASRDTTTRGFFRRLGNILETEH